METDRRARTIILPDDLHDAMKHAAVDLGVSLSYLAEEAIRGYLDAFKAFREPVGG